VTYMLAGRMRHRDNHGNSGLLVAGGAQWMTAGAGLIHSEMPEQSDGEMRGFQLWVNLPATHKMIAPRYQDIAPEQIPVLTPLPGASVRVIAGDAFGTQGPVQGIVTQPLFVDITLAAGAALTLPLEAEHSAFAYVFEGAGVHFGDTWLPVQELGVLGAGAQVKLRSADAPSRLILVAAAPLHEPVARYGPFVMNTRAQIEQAIADFRNGRM
ncbi:MAG: pirin family protein, partial [Metallibacterium scheffleri]